MKRYYRLLILISMMLILVFSLMETGFANDCPSQTFVDQYYDKLTATSVVAFREYADFYVNSTVWASIDIQTKRALARALACYYYYHGENSCDRCVIYDAHSGKKLAKYGAFGFKIY